MTNQAAPGSLRARLQELIKEASQLNIQLEDAIPEPSRHSSGPQAKRGKISAAPIPWFSRAAFLMLDLHAAARDREATLRMCAGQPVRPRGASDANTRLALQAIGAVSWAVDDGRVEDVVLWLEGWCRKALIALGEMDEPQFLPQLPGEKQPRCPFCYKSTLRMWPLRGEVRCINPGCRDEEKRKPRARMQYSEFTKNMELIWQDGIIGVPQ